MTHARSMGWAIGLALLGLSCAKTTDEANLGTNTNWLAECESDGACAGDSRCVCGVCTKACTESSQCGVVDERSTCEALEPYAQCGGETVASACVQTCETTADCTALEDPQCQQGLCVPDRPPVADPGPGRRDGAILDAGAQTDASDRADAAVMECVVVPLEVTTVGGLVGSRDKIVLEPCNMLRLERAETNGMVLASCSAQLGTEHVTSMNDLLIDGDVQRAMRDAPVLYGLDLQFIDVPLTRLTFDEAEIRVGQECVDAGGPCPSPIPEGINRLLDGLRELREAMITDVPSCGALQP